MLRPSIIAWSFGGGFLLTIASLSWSDSPQSMAFIAILALVALSMLLSKQDALHTGVIMAILLGATLGFWRMAAVRHVTTTLDIEAYASGGTVTLHGIIAAEPDRRGMATHYTVAVDGLTTASGTVIHPVRGRAMISDRSGGQEFAFGQRVTARGVLRTPEPFNDFAYDRYLARTGIRAVMPRAAIRHAGSGEVMGTVDRSLAWLFALKRSFEHRIQRLYGEPEASLAVGLLTGTRGGMPPELSEAFRITGLTHIVAVSGFNITLVLSALSIILFWIPLRLRVAPMAAGMALFVLFTGASASAVRAGIMGGIGLLALQTQRLRHLRLAILWSAVIMLLWNPLLLRDDPGFQLSFAAVIGLHELAPRLQHLLRRMPEAGGMKEALIATLAAQAGAMPVSLILFGSLPLLSPLSNLLVAPAIPYAMLLPLLGICAGFLDERLGLLLAAPGWSFVRWITGTAQTLAAVPGASVDLGAFAGPAALLFAAAATGCWWWMPCVTNGSGAASPDRAMRVPGPPDPVSAPVRQTYG